MSETGTLHQPDAFTEDFVRETAHIFIHSFQLHEGADWLWELREGWETTLQETLENWIWRYVRRVPPAMAETQFQMLLLEFEALYYRQEA